MTEPEKPTSNDARSASMGYEYKKEDAPKEKVKGAGLAYVEIIRPLNCVMAAVAVYIAAVIAGVTVVPSIPPLGLGLAMVVVFLICGAGMVANDIYDIEIDRVNKPKRPLPSGRMSARSAKAYAAALFIIGILVSYFINIYAFGVAVIASLLLVAYASKLKKVMFAGNVTVSLLVALTFIYGGLLNFSLNNFQQLLVVLPLAVLAFLSNIGRELYKTIEDALGDKKAGADTFAVKYGIFRARTIASAFIIISVFLSFVPFVLGTLGMVYLMVVIIADIIFIAAVLAPVRHASKFTKFAMLIALIAFLIGAIFK